MDNEIKEMIERLCIQRNKTVDDMILGEIRKIATENGIDTIITLNDKAIIQALKNFAEVKHGEWENVVVYNDTCIATCSNCRQQVVERECNATAFKLENEFCRKCGAKMDGGEAE